MPLPRLSCMAVFWRVKIGWREAACALLRSRWRWIVLLVEVIWLHLISMIWWSKCSTGHMFPYYFHIFSPIFTCVHTFPYILTWVLDFHTYSPWVMYFSLFFTGTSHRGHQTRARAPACTVGSNHYLLYDARWAPTTRMPQEASFFGGLC